MTWGIIYALIYLRSGNLLLVAGAHALINAPTLLLGDGGLALAGGAAPDGPGVLYVGRNVATNGG